VLYRGYVQMATGWLTGNLSHPSPCALKRIDGTGTR
jgi:hypothetical protein